MPFNLTNSVLADGDIDVREYKSSTGLTLVVCQVPGPIVHGFIILPTEAHDDLGIPHTLEHLCFLGSEDYPYKGVLDTLANRCLASGTNAWTDTDHTAYTISTAGPDGFLSILPIYLDHILYPTLADEAYVTEVHHINGKGEDGGVVYCEMQGRENSGDSIVYLEFLRSMYPGNCGYKSQTGGLLKDIRESLTNEKIRRYHSSFYRPENVCITVCGSVKDEDVISVLEKYEEKIIKKNRQDPFERPWQSPVPPLTENVMKTLQYPCDDDDSGMLWIGWRGPCCVTNYEDTISLGLLTDYLSDNAVSPMQQKFVEVDDPYCAEISCSLIENSESCLFFSFDSTCMKKVKNIGNEFLELLKSIASSPESIDMERMKSVIHRKKMQLLSSLETRPHSHISSSVIGAFLYAREASHLTVRLRQIPFYEEAEKADAKFWCSLITKYFLSQPYVLVIGEPSPSAQAKIAQEEKDRIAAQIASLGPAGLEEKAKIIENATSVCSIQAPPEVINSVPLATTENISYHTVKQFNTDNHSELNLSPIPYKFQIDDVNSNFIRITVYMNTTSEISQVTDFDLKLRPYLTLMYSLIAESAIDRDGIIIPYQDVINQLDSDTISCEPGFGICNRFCQLFAIRMKLEMEKYVKGVNWLRELIFQTVFEEERISVVLKKLLSDLNTKKREASLVCQSLVNSITYDSRCNSYHFAIHEQIKFLSGLSKKLKSDAASVINDLNSLRSFIIQSDNLIIHMALNQSKVAQVNGNIDLYSPWMDIFVPKKVRQASLGRVTRPIALSNQLFNIPQSATENGVIVGLGSVDSAYLEIRMMYTTSPSDPNLPALLVLSEYLSQLEGPLWRQIRGNGLAYGCHVCLNVHENAVNFTLYRSSNIHRAYELSKQVIERHVSPDNAWDQSKLESSRSALIYNLISKEKNLNAAADESLISYILGLQANHSRDLIAKISKVTLSDVKKVAVPFLSDLFNDNKICKSIVCNTSNVDDAMVKFTEIGVTLKKFDLETEINLDSKL